MSDYPMLISNKLHSFRNFRGQNYKNKGYICIFAANKVNEEQNDEQ